jgi:sugar/nucleoside kinase (ribokinase family)
MAEKQGIALVGSTIVDEVLPVVDAGRLTYVDAQEFVPAEELAGEALTLSVGGMACNVAVDLAKISGGYPIAVFGKVGRDHRAKLMRRVFAENGIPEDTLLVDEKYGTSVTEVFHVRIAENVIERFYRHHLGTMGTFRADDIPLQALAKFKIAMFGYGLLLPQLDLEDEKYGAVLGRVLAQTRKLGVLTALDFVSPDVQNLFKFYRYRRALCHVDILCINEDQASALVDTNDPALACRQLVESYGAQTAVVHCGAAGPNYAYSCRDGLIVQENFKVPAEECRGNAGAGDAFSAGFLHGVHQGWTIAASLEFAAATAAISIGHISCTGAMRNEQFILNYIQQRKN